MISKSDYAHAMEVIAREQNENYLRQEKQRKQMESTKMEKNNGDNSLESWNGFLGSNYLKATEVGVIGKKFIVTNVKLDDNGRPELILESNNVEYAFGVNVTNACFINNSGINSPKALVGKKIGFKIVETRNPETKKDVQSLRINLIE